MPSAPLVPLVRHVRRLAAGPDAGTADADLLARFIRSHEPAAFTALVARHGPRVWAVCRRLSRDAQAAEDAFQATFLVLARRPSAVRRPAALSSWLHGVAARVAARLRPRPLPVPPAPRV